MVMTKETQQRASKTLAGKKKKASRASKTLGARTQAVRKRRQSKNQTIEMETSVVEQAVRVARRRMNKSIELAQKLSKQRLAKRK